MPVILYCDVDGVFTDLDSALKQKFARKRFDINYCYQKLEQHDPSFFSTLPFLLSRRVLWDILLKNRFDRQGNQSYELRIIQGGQDRWAYEPRRKWIDEHLLKNGSETNILIEDKLSCEKSMVLQEARDRSSSNDTYYILLDDRKRWVDLWEAFDRNRTYGVHFEDVKSAFEGLISVLIDKCGVTFNDVEADMILIDKAILEENSVKDSFLMKHCEENLQMHVIDEKIQMKHNNVVDLTGDSPCELPKNPENVINLTYEDPVNMMGMRTKPEIIMNDWRNYDFGEAEALRLEVALVQP